MGNFFLLALIFSFSIEANPIKECPEKPNCVSTNTKQKERHINPIKITANKQVAFQKIIKILESTSGFKIISKTEDHIQAEYTSSFFKFVDDVEFFFLDKEIHMSSRSRKGHYDFNANRKRLENIRFRFHQNDI